MEAPPRPFDFESVFHAHYARIARVIARVIRDPARAEELAVEVLWKFWRTPRAQGEQAGGWLHRTAVRIGLNELRSRPRGNHHQRMSDATPGAPDPEQVRPAAETHEHVRILPGALDPRQGQPRLLRR